MSYVLIVLAGILIWTTFLRPRWRAKNAMPSIIQVLRDHNAVGLHNAKTIDEMGFEFKTPKSTIGRMFRAPDYRLMALQSLIKATVVQMTEEGKLYLSEENTADANKEEETENKEGGKR